MKQRQNMSRLHSNINKESVMENLEHDILTILAGGLVLPISFICVYFISDKVFDFIDYITKIK